MTDNVTVTKIYVPLSEEEFVALRHASQLEYRHPREQARYLLRKAMGLGENVPTNESNRVEVHQDIHDAAAS